MLRCAKPSCTMSHTRSSGSSLPRGPIAHSFRTPITWATTTSSRCASVNSNRQLLTASTTSERAALRSGLVGGGGRGERVRLALPFLVVLAFPVPPLAEPPPAALFPFLSSEEGCHNDDGRGGGGSKIPPCSNDASAPRAAPVTSPLVSSLLMTCRGMPK